MSISDSYINRIMTERVELQDKIIKIDMFINADDFETIVPNLIDRELLIRQSKIMHELASVLSERLSRRDCDF